MEQQKTTIVLPKRLHQRVRQLAAQRGESMGAFFRRLAERETCTERLVPRSFGMGDSGRTDISERIDELYEPDLGDTDR